MCALLKKLNVSCICVLYLLQLKKVNDGGGANKVIKIINHILMEIDQLTHESIKETMGVLLAFSKDAVQERPNNCKSNILLTFLESIVLLTVLT